MKETGSSVMSGANRPERSKWKNRHDDPPVRSCARLPKTQLAFGGTSLLESRVWGQTRLQDRPEVISPQASCGLGLPFVPRIFTGLVLSLIDSCRHVRRPQEDGRRLDGRRGNPRARGHLRPHPRNAVLRNHRHRAYSPDGHSVHRLCRHSGLSRLRRVQRPALSGAESTHQPRRRSARSERRNAAPSRT